MEINYCPNCGQAAQSESRFCYNCGADLAQLFGFKRQAGSGDEFKRDLKRFIEEFIEANSDLLKDLAAKVEKGEPLEKGMFFAVEMRGDKPIIKSGDIKDLEKFIKDTSIYPFFHHMAASKRTGGVEFKEAMAEVIESGYGRRVTVRLPGVSSIGDVMINRIGEGLEIVGRGEEVIYFSKVNLEGSFEMRDKRLLGEVLTIEVT
ncbi:MAG: zinc ribbon domain-containing protein [Candidatus Hydrothermarchaeales archaeon]